MYHEYTHLITSKSEEWLPLWLNEGWAEFYQTTELRDKEALLGQTSPENIMLLRENHMLPLPVLFTVDRASPYYHEENKGSIFYAESWALTDYLTVKDVTEHRHFLLDYVTLLSKGVDSVTAATRAFGGLQKLQQALQSYVSQSSYTYFKLHAETQVDESAFKVQAIPQVQADAVRADFLAYNRRTADSRALLEGVLKEDPNNAPAHETMGFLAFQQHQMDEARKWYGEAVKLNSQSYLANYYFAAIAMSSGPLTPDDEVQVENSLRAAIKLNPGFAPSYDRLGAFYGMRHQKLDEGYAAAVKATQLDPANLSFELNRANLLMEMGRTKDAVALIRSAVSLAKDPAEQVRLQIFLQNAEQYQEQMEQYNRSVKQQTQLAQPSAEDGADSSPPRLTRTTVAGANSPDSATPAAPLPEKKRMVRTAS